MTDEDISDKSEYTPEEMMIISAARALSGVRTVFVGVGLPNIACNLARHTVAPDLELIYESGIYGAQPARLPLSIGDPTLVTGAISVISMADLFGLFLQGGLVEVALVGGAQIDRYGNLNTSVIGSYTHPGTRLPGSGGACEIAINAQRVFIIMSLKKRAFVEQLDFLTSPGYLQGSDTRQTLGLPGAGPELIITDKALFNFDNEKHEMQLISLYPGVTREQIDTAMCWKVPVANVLAETSPPDRDELHLIRTKLDSAKM
jgi:glutaconate CoA-transferase, subunit B